MVETQDFCTRTTMIHRKNASAKNTWCIALDIGYSAVKGMSPNSVFSFPSYAVRFTGHMIDFGGGDDVSNDIMYRDENGTWIVGENAELQAKSDEAYSGIGDYNRNRYIDPMFKVIALVGLALGATKNECGNPAGKKIAVQTGLPPAYIEKDASRLRKILSGKHEFQVKQGNNGWVNYSLEINPDDVGVMPQPMGSFFSAATSPEATTIDIWNKLQKANVLIFDAGFGTVDLYNVQRRQINYQNGQSFDSCGMKAVLMRTAELIKEKYGTEMSVHAMQKGLRDGYILASSDDDDDDLYAKKVPFADLLEQANTEICDDAFNKMRYALGSLKPYDFFIITGGTGAAWQDIIRDRLKNLDSMTVLTANCNDTLSHIFSNVRGYYLYKVACLMAAEEKQKKQAEK